MFLLKSLNTSQFYGTKFKTFDLLQNRISLYFPPTTKQQEITMKKLLMAMTVLMSLNLSAGVLHCFTDTDRDGLTDSSKQVFQVDTDRATLVINGIVFGTSDNCYSTYSSIDCSYTAGGEPQRIRVLVNSNGWGSAQDMMTGEAETINCN